MSSLLANEFAEAGSDLQRAALLEVALILLVMSLTLNIVARYLVVGKGSRTAAAHQGNCSNDDDSGKILWRAFTAG